MTSIHSKVAQMQHHLGDIDEHIREGSIAADLARRRKRMVAFGIIGLTGLLCAAWVLINTKGSGAEQGAPAPGALPVAVIPGAAEIPPAVIPPVAAPAMAPNVAAAPPAAPPLGVAQPAIPPTLSAVPPAGAVLAQGQGPRAPEETGQTGIGRQGAPQAPVGTVPPGPPPAAAPFPSGAAAPTAALAPQPVVEAQRSATAKAGAEIQAAAPAPGRAPHPSGQTRPVVVKPVRVVQVNVPLEEDAVGAMAPQARPAVKRQPAKTTQRPMLSDPDRIQVETIKIQ